MAGNIYALLVGINKYAGRVPHLTGCVNDVERYHHFLNENYQNYKPEFLKNEEATRTNIIDQFYKHLCKAGPEDTALFIYAGHGAQSLSAPEFKKYFPEGVDEGIVCHDSRLPGHFDLADKELAVLIHEVAKNNPHIAVIMDACHSGGGTRDIDELGGLVSRYTNGINDARPLDTYLDGSPAQGFYANMIDQANSDDPFSINIPNSRHMLMAACQPEQTAKEDRRYHHGIFSDTMMGILEDTNGDISYADLFTQSRAKVRTRAKNQDPQFDTYENFQAYSGFLGRPVKSPRTRYYDVSFNPGKNKWELSAGAIQGIPADADKAVSLALFQSTQDERSLGDAATVQVGAASSTVKMPKELAGQQDKHFKARVTSMPLAPFVVQAKGNGKVLKMLEEGSDQSTGLKYTELYNILFSEEPGNAKYTLEIDGPKVILKQRETGDVIETYEDFNEELAENPFILFQHIARWERLLALQNHHPRMDPKQVDFVYETPVGNRVFKHSDGEDITLDYDGEPIPGEFKIRNRIGTKQDLFYMLLYFSDDYGIQKLDSGTIKHGENFQTIFDRKQKITDPKKDEEYNLLRLFITTEEVDPFLLTQDSIEKIKESLRFATKGFEDEEEASKFENDWFIKTFRVRLVRQTDEVGEKDAALANGAMTIKAHPSVKGKLSIGKSANPTRSLTDGPDVTEFLRANGLETIAFGAGSRDVDGGPSSLEISGLPLDVNDQLEKNPLEIELDAAQMNIGERESVMPVVFDGEHWLTGGDVARDEADASKITVSVDHVPDAQDTRSLGKALKLYFFKTYLNLDDVNQLRLVEFKEDGSVDRRNDKTETTARVAAGNNILLLVHGIIGDTKNIAEGIAALKDTDGNPLAGHFDAVLTYDYENLSTPIEQTAEQLKKDLREIAGIHEDDGKQLTILAHSMGGLVSRHFVEQLGGNRIVDHLIMCGTPNEGSPFGKVHLARKALNMLTVLSLNIFPGMAVAGPIITGILNRSKKLTPTLEQMNAESDFLKALNESPDPATRYTILGGDVEQYQRQSDQFFERLLEKTGKGVIFDALYGNSPHDIAVSKNSILSIEPSRNPAPVKIGVDCHHMNYFVPGPGLDALGKVEW